MNAKEQRRQDWQARIAAYRASGLSMKAWCNAKECSVEGSSSNALKHCRRVWLDKRFLTA